MCFFQMSSPVAPLFASMTAYALGPRTQSTSLPRPKSRSGCCAVNAHTPGTVQSVAANVILLSTRP